MNRMYIGFDDTDSPRTGCTTYVTALLVQRLRELGVSFIDYPNLIRLNPNVPWKTRGNGAICLRIMCEESLVEEVKESVVEAIEENADLSYDGTDPGVVFILNDIPNQIQEFAKRTIQGIVTVKEAAQLTKMFGADAVGFKKGRGIIGGLAAIGEELKGDHTYEIITYRTPENRGKLRRVIASSVTEMNRRMGYLTFNNIDLETNRILITPRGPDPILYGIRGEHPDVVKRAHRIVRVEEPIERWVIFRTNQGTDAHLKEVDSISELKPCNPVAVRGIVADKPRIISGGHVIFSIQDESGRVDCAAYAPTGRLKDTAKMLRDGDLIEAFGGVRSPSTRNPLTINLEKIQIIKIAPQITYRNPQCPKCGKRMTSMGKDKGFECERCGLHGPYMKKIPIELQRSLKPGIYVTSSRSQRHLTKPLSRYGLEKERTVKSNGCIPYEDFYRVY